MKKNSITLLPSRLLSSVVLLGLFNTAYAEGETFEFDSNFFSADQATVTDVSRFSRGNYVPAGVYNVDVFVNKERKGRTDIRYMDNGEDTYLCFSDELQTLLDLQPNAYVKSAENIIGLGCQAASVSVPEAKFRLDTGLLRLNVEIPQALTVQRPRGYISPKLWENGVPAAFVNYNISHYTSKSKNSSRYNTQYLYLDGGINVAGWTLRHNGSLNRNNGVKSPYNRGDTYIQGSIVPLRGQLTIGDFTTQGQIVDSVSLRGVSLNSDNRMIPQSQRGYAPRIQGVANSDSLVTIRQSGNVIYQTNVPAGPFVINDLYPTGYSGELEVEVVESNGQSRTFTVPYATLVPLMRPGQFDYQLAGGYIRQGNEVLTDEKVATVSASYGLFNNLTVNGGVIKHQNYLATNAGVAFNTPIGALSGDITHSDARFPAANENLKGYSIRANYSLNITPTDTNITLATYRYFSRDYYSLNETISTNRHYADFVLAGESIQTLRYTSIKPKNQYQISVSQALPENWGSLYLTGISSTYWNQTGTSHEYQISYSNAFRIVSYQISFSQTKQTGSDKMDSQVYASFSMPLSSSSNAGYYSSGMVFSNNRNTLHNRYSQTLGEFNQFNYSVLANVVDNQQVYTGGSMHYRSNYATFNTSVGRDRAGSSNFNASMSGAVVAHPKGITLSNRVGDSFAIIHAKNGAGAMINNGSGKRLDYFGNAIVSYVTPFEKNTVGISPRDLPMNIEFDATSREIIPKANTAILVNLNAHKNTMVLFNLEVDSDIPLGAEAYDSKGEHVGYVTQGGMLFANRLTETKDRISVKWGSSAQEQCYFDYSIPTLNDQDVEGMLNIDVQCVKRK